MPKTNISLEEYHELLKADYRAFKEYWRTKQQQEPKNYPVTMNAGDWDEQFAAYMQSIRVR